MGIAEGLIVSVLAALGGWLGGFFGAYAKKKGENLATHEDLDKVVDQVKATTEATKRIEAQISGEAWDRQKQWEMKKEVLFEAIKRLSEADNALLDLRGLFMAMQSEDDKARWLNEYTAKTERWSCATTALDESRLFAAVICSRETRDALDNFGIVCNAIVAQLRQNPQSYDNALVEFNLKLRDARNAIRKELGIGLQSSVGQHVSSTTSPPSSVPLLDQASIH